MRVMRRYIKIVLFLFLFVLGAQAKYMDELRSYLLSKDFSISGEFFLSQDRWIFGYFDKYGQIVGYYQLMGTQPTTTNPFGWREANASQLVQMQGVGYFIKIDFPFDMQNPYLKPYSWIYVDMQTKNVYKLIGADKGIFKYYDRDLDGVPDPIDQIYFYRLSNKAKFFSCKDSVQTQKYDILKLAKSSGSVQYDCGIGGDRFIEKNGSKLTNAVVDIQLDGKLNGKRFFAKIFKEPFKGLVTVEGLYGGRYMACTKEYEPVQEVAVDKEALSKFLMHWGEGKGDGYISGNCVLEERLLDRVQSAELTIVTTITTTNEANNTAKIEILEQMVKRP